jgi:glucosamine--fructose-6-phosphate aminotransferase (isomerizing)
VTSSGPVEPAHDPTPYLRDVLDQPRALTAFLDTAGTLAAIRSACGLSDRPRVVISGMGSSHYGTFGLWRGLVRAGIPAWWIDTAQLLDGMDRLLVPGALLWLTSQSGASGEVVRLLDELPPDVHVVGVTNNPESALGTRSHTRVDLLAGNEATVSTKSYLNTVAVARLVAAEMTGTGSSVMGVLRDSVVTLSTFLNDLEEHVGALAGYALDRTLLLTGRGEAAVSAQAGSLIVKEAAKQPVEGMSGGSLRHGVIELAGPGLAVAFFDRGTEPHRDQNIRLATDLAASGTEIGWFGAAATPGSMSLATPGPGSIDPMLREALAFQTLSFALAKRAGVTPGAFLVASKVTDVL